MAQRPGRAEHLSKQQDACLGLKLDGSFAEEAGRSDQQWLCDVRHAPHVRMKRHELACMGYCGRGLAASLLECPAKRNRLPP